MVEIIFSDNGGRWNEIVRSMERYDFFHLAEYHNLDTSGQAVLFSFEQGDDSFAFPLILRRIEGTDYCDITSVYGYAGPLQRRSVPCKEVLRNFHEALKNYFTANRIVSAFSRLHPLIPSQDLILEGLGSRPQTNITVGIDLTIPAGEQWNHYSHSLKNRINRQRRIGIEVLKASGKEDMDAFIRIYRDTMDRVGAEDSYYYPPDYFYRFAEQIDSELFLAKFNGIYICGSLCTFCNGIIEAHLSGTSTDHLYLSPLKLIWDEVRLEGNKRAMKVFHLGGGFHGRQDSLYDFKSQFSNQRYHFCTWHYIHDAEMYEVLTTIRRRNNGHTPSFFPTYRS